MVGDGFVIVRSNDGRVTAFDIASGQRRWFWQSELPSLTVRGNDHVTLGPGCVFVGNDDGSVAALSTQDGRLLWEQAVAQTEGRSELDRMADVDGAPVLDNTTIYATSFKGQTLAIDGPRGRPIWQRDNGGAGRIGTASDRVVVSDRAGSVWATTTVTSTGCAWIPVRSPRASASAAKPCAQRRSSSTASCLSRTSTVKSPRSACSKESGQTPQSCCPSSPSWAARTSASRRCSTR